MKWYLPMTIIPGVGLIILSTSNIMLSVNSDITNLLKVHKGDDDIVKAKLSQLKRVSISIVFQYIAVLLFLLAGVIAAIFSDIEFLSKGALITGVLSLSSSIVIMLVYSIKAVAIRQRH
jgi:hypothetical protein